VTLFIEQNAQIAGAIETWARGPSVAFGRKLAALFSAEWRRQ